MKKISFIHISDLHLSAPFKKDLFIDPFVMRQLMWECLEKTVVIANKYKVDFLFITGDIFESRYFTVQNLERFLSILKKFSGKSFLIFGNHDYLNAEELFSRVNIPENVILNFDKNIKMVYIKGCDTAVYMHSWTSDPVGKIEYKFDFDKASINILMLHSGMDIDRGYFSDAYQLLDNHFDYIALGHIHKPGAYKKNAYYSGSLVPLSIKETGPHGAIYGEISDELSVKFIPISNVYYQDVTVDVTDKNFEDLEEELMKFKKTDYTILRCKLVGYDDRNIDLRELEATLRDVFTSVKFVDNRIQGAMSIQLKCDERFKSIMEYAENLDVDEETRTEIINKALGYLSGWL